ncbi:MAG TPA: FmdB family transcriptional regulator [Verrucomicrobiales bacterium]|jgi:putative FmdB family regulatory protein|nr:MAG: FmdB family transcriptional regulator [Verrucomicrobiae bacterium Tous-C3TDCM]PAZ06294.1 MAG: FmdB family transcriptional regulator [Verrucomicrobiae bacterium AMD-G2]HBE22563.1 FmdB family transcriptional regulator [Verrucomicrobiales bacterium]
MPNYDYECETCGKRFELFQSMKDDKLVNCPTSICDQGGKVKRLLGTGGGIIFKGGGFYQTDYRSESYQSGAKKDSASQATPAAAPAPAKESKPSGPTSA